MREEAADNATPTPTTPPNPTAVHCPQCGGLAKRPWSHVLILDLAVFIGFTMLAPVMIRMFVGMGSVVTNLLALAWIAIALLSLLALPFLWGIAVAARACCESCGHRFWPPSNGSSEGAQARFPVRSAVAGGLLLTLPLVVGLTWVRSAPGQETWTVGLTLIARIIMAVLALGLGLLFQAVLWKRLRRYATDPIVRGLSLLLPAAILGAAWLALTAHDRSSLTLKFDPVIRAPGILGRGGLAALPLSRQGVKVHMFRAICSGSYYLRFSAEPNDIERFLAESPSLEGVECRTYSSQRKRLRGGDYVSPSGRRDAHGNEYFAPERDVPRWYRQEIHGPGRRYEISWYDGKYQGELIVDDEAHVVYVHIDRL